MGPYNAPLGDTLAIPAFIPPQSLAAGTYNTTGVVDMSVTGQAEAIVGSGTLGTSGTIDFKFQYSSDKTTWYDVPTSAYGSKAAITQITANNTFAKLTLRAEALAGLGGTVLGAARYVQGVMTVGGSTASEAFALIQTADVKFEPNAHYNDNAAVASNALYTTSNTSA